VKKYLVVYDYGTGGLWWYIHAESAAAITSAFHDLEVFESPPPWWSDEMEKLTATKVYRLGEPLTDEVLARFKR